MMTKDQLVEMFDDMSHESNWDMSGPMTWGHFFKDPARLPLDKAAPLLEQKGYRVVDIRLSNKDSPEEPDVWRLHAEKIETHTPETLHQRNLELYTFADACGIDCYDGMDVGPANE